MRVTLFRDLPTERWFSMDRYADELTAALRALGCDVRPYVLPRPWPSLRGRVNAMANYAWRLLIYPLAARGQQGVVNHILDHSYAHLIRALDAHRTVVTCHDVAPLVFDPAGQSFSGQVWRWSFAAMFRASRILTISQFSRSEILKQHPVPEERLPVIGYGISPSFSDREPLASIRALRSRYTPKSQPLLLHVGTCQPRKNLEAVLRALPDLRALDPRLVQVGGQFSLAQHQLIQTLGLERNVLQVPPASGAELRTWYQAADVLVFPSWYEGFGLPVLEAMASGTPVVCANTGALAEVAADAALLVDPADAPALAEAVQRVVTDQAGSEDLRARGRARAAQFSWEAAARQTLAVYTAVYQERG